MVVVVLLCALAGWAAALVCPICGKRNCPWYVHPSSARRPIEIEKRIKQEVLRKFPDWVRAQERGAGLPELLRLARDIQTRPEFKAAVGARLAQDPEYNRYRTAVLEDGDRRLRRSQARLTELLETSSRDAKEAIARLAGSDPALRPSDAQTRVLIDSPDLGQLFLALGAGKFAKGAVEHAAKAVAAIPFDDAADDAGAIAAAIRSHRDNLGAAVQKRHEAAARFQNIQEAAPTAAERAELMRPGEGKTQAQRALAEQASAASAGHAEAQERVKGGILTSTARESPSLSTTMSGPAAAGSRRRLNPWPRKTSA